MTGQALIDALGNVAAELDEDNFATNARVVREAVAEVERLTALVRQTREEAEAAIQRAAEGELAARTEVERLTARLQTAERVAHEWRERCEGKWDKAHVEAAFRAWLYEGVALDVDALTLEEREAPAWADLRARIEAEGAGA